MENNMTLDWLTFTYKPQNSKSLDIQKELTQHDHSCVVDEFYNDYDQLVGGKVRAKLPIDYFFCEFPSLKTFVLENSKQLPKGRFNYNSGFSVGSGNGYQDFMILFCTVTDTANTEKPLL